MTTKSAPPSIIVVEPQCWGFEHSSYNAALLHTVCRAYPAHVVAFCGETTHLNYVKEEIDRGGISDRIDLRSVNIPRRETANWGRLAPEFALCGRVFREADRQGVAAVVFSSTTNTGLLAIKTMMRIKRFRAPTVAVVHGCLSTILDPMPRRPWNWIVALKHVLALPHPENLRLIALGDSVLANIRKVQSKRQHQWSCLDLACLWPSDGNASEGHVGSRVDENGNTPFRAGTGQPVARPLRFGFLGAGMKGFQTFCRVADDVAPSPEEAEFVMVGFYHPDASGNQPKSLYVPVVPERPLTRAAFESAVRQLAYVVWTTHPDRLRLAPSATFVDALAFLKPGIYLRNDYLEHHFRRMGDIGYLCDSREEIVETIRAIISDFPTARYRHQVDNIRRGRAIFEPQSLAPRLRAILESCAGQGGTAR
jgi:hypothetical protein